MSTIWQVQVSIPGLGLRYFFRSDEQPTAAQVFAAINMEPPQSGDPFERGLSADERMARLYPAITLIAPIKIIDLVPEISRAVAADFDDAEAQEVAR